MHSDDIKVVDVSKRDIVRYVNGIIIMADSYELSEFKCLCGRDHYMVWPSKRDDTDYNKTNRLTYLPICPIRAWDESAELKHSKSLYTFLGELRQHGRNRPDTL